MITIPLNGARLRLRLIEAEVSRLKLDPENPRLHSAYLTHDLPARPNEKQIAAVLEQLPEFQALLDAITRNDGVFQPPLLTADFRVLEGNRRVTALRKLHAAEPKNPQWRTVTAHQLGARLPAAQERALRVIYTERDEERPQKQPFTLQQVMKWLVEERFTQPYEDGERTYAVAAYVHAH